MPSRGELVGRGAMSEVFAWDEGRVVKLFLPAYDFAVEREHDCAQAVHRAGVASPAVHGIPEVDDRRGIVYDRVDGPTLLDQLLRSKRSPAEALARERAVRARILDSYLAAYLAAEPIGPEDVASWLARAASSLHGSEPESADAADLRALVDRRHDDLVEPVLTRLLAH